MSRGTTASVLPAVGIRLPGYAPRVAFLLVAAALCLLCVPPGPLFAVVVAAALASAMFPQRLVSWAAILLLGFSQLLREPSLQDWRFFVLLAGLPLLQSLAAQFLLIPLRSSVQLRVFRRPLLRYLAFQLPVQAVAVLTLSLTGAVPGVAVSTALAIAGALALTGLVLLLIVPLLVEDGR